MVHFHFSSWRMVRSSGCQIPAHPVYRARTRPASMLSDFATILDPGSGACHALVAATIGKAREYLIRAMLAEILRREVADGLTQAVD